MTTNNVQKISAAMPGTRDEIADRTGLTTDAVRNTICKYMRNPRCKKLAYISGWSRLSRGGRGTAIYALGDLPDVEPEPTDRRDYHNQYTRELRAKARAEREASAPKQPKQPKVKLTPEGAREETEKARKRKVADMYCQIAASQQQTPFSALFARHI